MLVLLRSSEVCSDVTLGLGLSGIGKHICTEVQVQGFSAQVLQLIFSHQKVKNLAKGCDSLSISLLFAEKWSE